MEELALLQQKLNRLIKSFSALQAEKMRLQKVNLKQEKHIEAQKQEIEYLKKEAETNAVSGVFNKAEPEKKEHLKQQLDKVIRELEKNIALLK